MPFFQSEGSCTVCKVFLKQEAYKRSNLCLQLFQNHWFDGSVRGILFQSGIIRTGLRGRGGGGVNSSKNNCMPGAYILEY